MRPTILLTLALFACSTDDPDKTDPTDTVDTTDTTDPVDTNDDGTDTVDTDDTVDPVDTDVDDLDGDGFTVDEGDCNDDVAAINPGATDEVGNSVDDNCDGIDGVDGDADGYASLASGGDDCDDAVDAINPGAAEVWYDGVDDNCDGQGDSDQDGDGFDALVVGLDCDDTDPFSVGGPPIQSLFPEADAVDVYFLTEVSVDVQGTVSASGFELREASTQTLVPSTTTLDSNGDPVLVPDQPLQPLTTYQASLECGPEWTFTVGEHGQPVTVDLTGESYEIDLMSLRITEPPGIGGLVTPLLGDFRIGMSVVDHGATTIDLRFAALDEVVDEQDLCAETVDISASIDAQGTFEAVLPTLTVTVDGTAITLEDVSFSGTFAPDGDDIAGMSLSATADTRGFDPLLGLGGVGATCTLVTGFGVTCGPCANGQPFCLTAAGDNGEATLFADAIVQRTSFTIANDPQCFGSSGCSCDTRALPGSTWLLALLAGLGLRRRRVS
jgi:hypothetical protein